jgi:hypothetical protein
MHAGRRATISTPLSALHCLSNSRNRSMSVRFSPSFISSMSFAALDAPPIGCKLAALAAAPWMARVVVSGLFEIAVRCAEISLQQALGMEKSAMSKK